MPAASTRPPVLSARAHAAAQYRQKASVDGKQLLVATYRDRAVSNRERPWFRAVLATLIIRHSSHPSAVMMEPVQYRKCDDVSSTIGGGGMSS